MRLGVRLLLSFVMVSIIPIAFLVIGGLKTIAQLNELLMRKTNEETQKLFHELVQQKAYEVATLLGSVLEGHPEIDSVEEYRANPEIRQVAIQRVGKIGYTALVAPNGDVILHPDPSVEGRNMLLNPPRELYPDFIALYKAALDSVAVSGYYTWPERDGTIKRKYLATYRTRNNMVVFATAYIDDMQKPLVNSYREVLQNQAEIIKSKMTLLGVLAVLIATITGTSIYASIVKPIRRIKLGIAAFSEGDYSYRIPISSSTDEINTVAALLNQFSEQLSITSRELKKETEKLADSEARYRAIVENMNQSLALVDSRGIITYVNPAFSRVLGYKPDDTIGQKFTEFVHKEDLALIRRHAGRAAMSGQKNFQMRLRAKHKLGYMVMFEINATLVYSRDGRLAYTVVLGQDITETHKLHRELETASLIMEQVGTGIALFTSEGKLAFSNRQWAMTHGYSDYHELRGQPLSAFFPPHALESAEHSFLAALNETPSINELTHIRRDGTEISALTTFHPFYDSSDRLIGVICSTCDITEYHKELQELQRKSDILEQRLIEIDKELETALLQLREAENMKTDFLGTISHELRTPLNAIEGLSKYLLESAHKVVIERHGEELKHIYQNSLYLHDLITSL
ncbi:MAG TPA: PAS domain S-box protein, partial [Proteobacteria bacterium]|nr:PAS domain S-box protein [Pseudomonadota bacterium]